jgi:hypothetical protein
VRLGVLGPANGDVDALVRTAAFLLNDAKVGRAIYLGADDALDEAVALWTESLVGTDASDVGLWDRAFAPSEEGTAAEIDAFLRGERARLRLKCLEGLAPPGLRSVEMVGDRLTLVVYDTAGLDEDDIFSAGLVVYGKSETPVVRRIGPRWFLSPGSLGGADGGAAVVDDSGDAVVIRFYDGGGRESGVEKLEPYRASVLTVQAAASSGPGGR